MRWCFPLSAIGTSLVLFVLPWSFGCGSQPTSVPASLARQDSSATAIGGTSFLLAPGDIPAAVAPSDSSKKVQFVLDRIVNTVVQMDSVTWFGLAALVAMLLFYTLENRSPFYILAFATACWTGSAYGYLRGSWPIGIVAGIWGCVALRKCWGDIKSKNDGARKVNPLIGVWHIRFMGVLAVIAGIVLLIVDSPISAHFPIPLSRAVAEAIPLLLVGIAYLAWLAIDGPPIVDLIKQALLAVAFILWGVSLLMPVGPWAKFVGAVVIAIYVFDLAWLMEGNLRRKFGVDPRNGANGCMSSDCRSAGVCSCEGVSGDTRASNNGGHRSEGPLTLLKK